MVMEKKSNPLIEAGTAASQRLLILAQILVLAALAMGLQFLVRTTGGTLFLFASIAPVLVTAAVLILAVVAIQHFRRLYSLFTVENYDSGQIIFRQGDFGECAYFIQSGKVEVVREEKDGGQTVLATLSPGQYFGEMALLSKAPRNATIRAAGAAKLAVLGKRNFLTMLNVMPSVHEDILKTMQERAMKQAQ